MPLVVCHGVCQTGSERPEICFTWPAEAAAAAAAAESPLEAADAAAAACSNSTTPQRSFKLTVNVKQIWPLLVAEVACYAETDYKLDQVPEKLELTALACLRHAIASASAVLVVG